MSKNWSAAELATLETQVASLESAKVSSPSTWATTGGRRRAISMKANMQRMAPDNLVADSFVQRHKSVVARLENII